MLKEFDIQHLVDVRLLPGSRKFPQFNQVELQTSLAEYNIIYTHFRDLGGRRKPKSGSFNTGWNNLSFRGYADYMQTETFQKAVIELEALAKCTRVAFMCAEAVWWSCHRSLIADYLKHKGWLVRHIMATGKIIEHPYTSPARIVQGDLVYPGETGLFG